MFYGVLNSILLLKDALGILFGLIFLIGLIGFKLFN